MSQEGVIDIIGTHPEIPTEFIANVGSAVPIANTLEVLGEVVAAGTNPFRSIGSGNTITYQVQIAQAIAGTDATKIGLSAFNNSQFSVDANGFVSLSGGGLAVDSFQVQANTAPGVNPVLPDVAGLVTVSGAAVANHSVVLETRSRALNAYNLEIQYATSAAATDATKSGVAHFNSGQFSVDANGFVSLAGGGEAIDSIAVQTGTSPIVPTVAGLVTINGAVVAAGTNPLRTNGTGANTMALEVQISQAIAAADATKIGLSNFNSAHFSIDANGFVSLTGGGQAIDSFTTDVSGPVSPDGAGNVAFTGSTNIFSDGSVANTMRLNLQGTNHALYVGRGTNTASANLAVGTNGQVLIAATGADPAFATLTSSDGSITFTPGANTLSLQVTGGTSVGKTITGNTGGALSPTAGNWNIPGNNNALNGFAAYSTGSGSTLTINSFGRNIWVVHPTSGVGTHTTIQAAVTAASSGDTIVVTAKSTAYTENVTLKAGVNIVADTADAFTPNVTISGTLTHNTAGTVSISGIRLQTASAALLAVTGSAASIINLINCNLNCSNNTGITFSSSSSSAAITMTQCSGNLGTTGIAIFSHSSAGSLTINNCSFTNSGGSSTASTCSAGVLNAFFMNMVSPVTFSSTAAGTWEHCLIDTSPQNVTAMTLGGSGIQSMKWCRFTSGSASAISISTSAIIEFCTFDSTNTNAITGAGTIKNSVLSFNNTSNTINTTTQTPLISRFGIQRSTTHPAFLAFATTQTNVTGDNTLYTITFNTEIFDQNSNFDAVSTFTAPVTGRYHLNADIIFNDVGAAHTGCIMTITTSNRAYYFNYFNIGVAQSGGVQFGVNSVLADMDAADTAIVTVQIGGGTKIIDINILSNFSGNLFC